MLIVQGLLGAKHNCASGSRPPSPRRNTAPAAGAHNTIFSAGGRGGHVHPPPSTMQVIHEHEPAKFALQYTPTRAPRPGGGGEGHSGLDPYSSSPVGSTSSSAKRAASLYASSGAKLHPKKHVTIRRSDGGGSGDEDGGAAVRFLHASPSELAKLNTVSPQRRIKLSAARVRAGFASDGVVACGWAAEGGPCSLRCAEPLFGCRGQWLVVVTALSCVGGVVAVSWWWCVSGGLGVSTWEK